MGVTVSLALDHAPFTRMTPFGTFVPDCTLSEKSPPFLGGLCGLAAWPQANNDTKKKTAVTKRKNPLYIISPIEFRRRGLRASGFGNAGTKARNPTAEARSRLTNYKERRKSNMSCCCVVVRLKNCSSTMVASLLWLAWS